MTWAEDMRKYADYFVRKFHDQDDWYLPDHLEHNANYPYAEDQIHALFTEFAQFADPPTVKAQIKAEIEAVEAAAKDVDRDFCDGVIDGMDVYLDYWHGDTADGFKRYMKGPQGIGVALAYKRDRIEAAKYALQAYERTIAKFQQDVLTFVEENQKAVEDGQAKANEIKLSLASAVVSIGVAAATAGAGFAVTVAVGDVLQSATSDVNQIYLEGSAPEDIIGMMPDKGQPILKTARQQLDHVSKAFQKLLHGIETGWANMLPRRPSLVTDDHFDPDQFHRDDQSKEQTGSVSREDLVKEPDKDPRANPEEDAKGVF